MTKRRTLFRVLTRPLLFLLALVFLFEAWLWRHLVPIVGWIVALIPLAQFKAKVASTIERLPPYPTLLVFLVPLILLLPLKLLGVWLLSHGHWLAALGILGLAKVVSLGVTAFIFELTRPKLLQLPWFRWLYEHVLVWLEWAHGLVDPIKVRIRRVFRMFGPGRAGRTIRLLARIRRRMRAHAAA